MKKLIFTLAILLLFGIKDDLYAQKLVEMRDGNRFLGYIEKSIGPNIIFKIISGDKTILPKSLISDIKDIFVEVKTVDGKILQGHIRERRKDSIVFIKNGGDLQPGEEYSISENYTEIIIPVSEIADVEFGNMEGLTLNKRYKMYSKDYPFFGVSIGVPSLIGIVGGYTWNGLGVRGVFGGFGLGKYYSSELGFYKVLWNNTDLQIDLGIAAGGIFSDYDNDIFSAVYSGIMWDGLYAKLGLCTFLTPNVNDVYFLLDVGWAIRFNEIKLTE